jgi:hypothetical protein
MSANTRVNILTTSGSVGTTAAIALATTIGTGTTRNFLQIQNTHISNQIYYTLDGTTPSASVGFVLGGVSAGTAQPDSFHQYFDCVPTGPVTVIGSAAGTTWTIGSG